MVTMEDVLWMAETIYMYLPAYLANAAPVLAGGGNPLDEGRIWRDGRPILGGHKTVRGTFIGIAVGFTVGLIQMQPLRGALLALGAICGDLIVAFVKRRLGLKPGAPFPVADQLGFIIFAIAFSMIVPPPPSWERIVAILIATIPIHFITNFFAWLLKLKANPW